MTKYDNRVVAVSDVRRAFGDILTKDVHDIDDAFGWLNDNADKVGMPNHVNLAIRRALSSSVYTMERRWKLGEEVLNVAIDRIFTEHTDD